MASPAADETWQNLLSNMDVEHDEEHFASTYRDALAAIKAWRKPSGGRDSSVVINYTDCPYCLLEAVIAIASGLGDDHSTHAAAAQALRAIFDDMGGTPPDFTLPEPPSR